MGEMMQKLRGSSRQHVNLSCLRSHLPSEVEVCSRRGRRWDGGSSHRCLQSSSGGPVKSQDIPVAQADLARAAGVNGPEPPPRGDGAAIHHWISIPCELGPLRAASPRDDWKRSHVSVWRTALFLAPSEAEGGLSHSHFHPCAGAKHNRRRCLFVGCLVSRTSCPDMELLLAAPLRLLKYA